LELVLKVSGDDELHKSTESGHQLVSIEREAPIKETVVPFVAKYCGDCHTGAEAEKGLRLTDFQSAESIAENRAVWKKVVQKLRSREMPPKDAEKPAAETCDEVVHLLSETLAEVAHNAPHDPGRVTMRRLNRAEYNYTLRDLLGIDFRPADDFPADDVGYGFDNNGDVLSLPPLLLEKYLAAAEKVLRLVLIVDDGKSPQVHRFGTDELGGVGFGRGSNNKVRTLRRAGEAQIDYDFPREAEYIVRFHAWGTPLADERVRMGLKLDGAELQTFDLNADQKQAPCEFKLHVTGGRHRVAATFLNPFQDPYESDAKKARSRALHFDYAEIEEPILDDKQPPPEPYQRIMVADPAKVGRDEAARQIIRHFADRAFRRPVDDEQLDRLMKVFATGEGERQSFEQSLLPALTAVLVSPRFLYRLELDAEPNNPGVQRRLDDWELASRLSYFLWGSMPDEELFNAAQSGQLRDQLQSQIDRMLRDPKAEALVTNFAGQWLQSRRLDIMQPDPKQFPGWNDQLRESMRQEGLAVFDYIMRENRSLLEFIDAPYAFLNHDLAKLYGIDGVHGENFRRVDLPPGSPRGGVITLASVLTTTSNPDRTSPVKRGKWILENILGTPPPPPLPDVPQLVTRDNGRLIGTVRQQMEQHRKDPHCATCHERMDPLGFGLENFDAIGAWRDREGGAVDRQNEATIRVLSKIAGRGTRQLPMIDASGTLPDGRKFNGPAELKKILLAQRDLFCRAFSEKMLIYALGRGTAEADDPAIDSIADAVTRDGYKFSRLVFEIVTSEPFQMRRGASAVASSP
jgi:hypothetical protein